MKTYFRNFIVSSLIAAVCLLTLASCQGLQTRGEANQPNSNQPARSGHPVLPVLPGVQPGPAIVIPSTPANMNSPGGTLSPLSGNSGGNVPAMPVAPTFLSKELPKVGVILGAGGMKAYAHLGVLREFQRARIPIHAVIGMEWGAVIGGLYSIQGQINDAEWKSFKLRGEELPSHGFLSARIKPASINTLKDFFSETFGSGNMDRAKIPFACISYSARSDRLSILEHGGLHDAMNRCVPYPPMFADNGGALAEPFAVNEAAAWLRAHGANVVVLINVMGQGEIFPANLLGEQASENVLWSEIRRSLISSKAPTVNWVINVNTSGHPITDADGRRAIMDVGTKAAVEVVNKMAAQYGF